MDNHKTHKQCLIIFEQLFDTEHGQSVGCDIWNAFVGDEENFDNCIGENFNQLLWSIKRNWFDNHSFADTSVEFYNITYIFWLYLIVSRAYEIFDSVNPKKTNDLIEKRRNSLKTFNEINLWAKFIKHPKEFIFCHWPEASCEGQRPAKIGERIVINTNYLKEHYSAENNPRPIGLKNKTNVVVQYPKLSRITEGFVADFLSFRDFMCKNEMVIEELKKDSNIKISLAE